MRKESRRLIRYGLVAAADVGRGRSARLFRLDADLALLVAR